MNYATVCSGIGAPEAAWEPTGWRCAFQSEIEPFPCAVLKHHYPNVPNYGDMTQWRNWPDANIDVLCGGTPCQSFSVAGLRGGMADPRGNLALVYLSIVDRYRPRWVVWENVPGVLSSNGGRDFGAFIGALGQLGYGWAYRILDAQYFGVPQRRRRVFVVGYLGDWRRAAAVLFERESMRGDSAPRRETREEVAGTLGGGSGSRGWSNSLDTCGAFVAGTVSRKWAKGSGGLSGDECQNLVAHTGRGTGHDASEDGTGRGEPLVAFRHGASVADGNPVLTEHTPTLRKGDDSGMAICYRSTVRRPTDYTPITLEIRGRDGGCNLEYRQDGTANALRGSNGGRAGIGVGAIAHRSTVRRLTPRECERLQGFPDDYTLTQYRGKPAADGPRYKAIGNSMAVPVLAWLGRRIKAVDALGARKEN